MASILKAGRRAILWSAGVGMAVPLLIPAVLAEDSKKCCCKDGKIRPSQLPIYDEPEDLYDMSYEVAAKGQVQEGVEVVRKELTEIVESTKDFRDQVEHIIQTGKAHTAGQVDYLLNEENVAGRAAAIATGGLIGLLLGARKKGGFIKKVFFTSAGVGVTTAALYPRHTRQYSNDLVTNANTYATVAYNFCIGVKPQSEVTEPGPAKKTTPATALVQTGKSKQVEKEPSKAEGGDGSTKDEVIVMEISEQKTGATKDHGQSNPDDDDMYTTRS